MREVFDDDRRFRFGGPGSSLPVWGHLELTYRCNLRCAHCYARGTRQSGELTAGQWKEIIKQAAAAGCFSLSLSGGEHLLHDDFWQIYRYAKRRGLLVNLCTNATLLDDAGIRRLAASPPAVIEVTLNGVTARTYESITGVPGSFARVMEVIRKLKAAHLPLVLKANALKQNRHELMAIKEFALKTLGRRRRNTLPFKLDPLICARLNGDATPCRFRLPPKDVVSLFVHEPSVRTHALSSLRDYRGWMLPGQTPLYLCDSCRNGFYVNPSGRLKFCLFSEAFSVDLNKVPFAEGFSGMFPRVASRRFRTASRCRRCRLRALCYQCPERAFLETGSRERPIRYFCELARRTAAELAARGEKICI